MRISKFLGSLPTLNLKQRNSLLDLMHVEFGVSLLQQQEIAGGLTADLVREVFLKGNCQDKGVLFLVGNGFKAGIALVCARRLHTWGAKVRICHDSLPPVPSAYTHDHLNALQRMGIIAVENPAPKAALIIDGLLDLGVSPKHNERSRELIAWSNEQINPVLALDIPSGIDADTGSILYAPVLRASATLALGLPVQGLIHAKARPFSPEIYLADLGIPRAAWASPGFGIEVPSLFSENSLVKIR